LSVNDARIAAAAETPIEGASEFAAWLRTAAPGDRAIYYLGQLTVDRSVGSSPFTEQRRSLVDHLANEVLAAAVADRVVLVQQRLGPRMFAYIAVAAGLVQRRRATSRSGLRA
jgi:hypothetical protein